MEKVEKGKKTKRTRDRKKNTPWYRRISIKGALVCTTLCSIVLGFFTCMAEVYTLSTVHNDIYETYVQPYLPEEYADGYYSIKIESISPDGTTRDMVQRSPNAYVDPETGELYPMEQTPSYTFIPAGFFRFLYQSSDLVVIILCFLTAILFFVLDAAWFYRWKIRKPLGVLNLASQKISENDLDFTIPQPSTDELGKLCGSFEKMRLSLEENNKAMWNAMEERRRLNAAFAHDLRTPLTVLQGYSDYLLDGLPSGDITAEKAEETVETMKRSLIRLQRYVEGMNSLQKMEDVAPIRKKANFCSLASQLRETASILCGPDNLVFSADGKGSLQLDTELIFQVFENLMSNACRYAQKRIQVCVGQREGFFQLSVTDDGPGFPQEALKRAVEPYYRADKKLDGTPQGSQHFGLGLYICRILCEKHGGWLSVKNSEEGGASVTAVFRT